MTTKHLFYVENSNKVSKYIPDKSVALVVTSPPYPMIEMWNECFSSQDKNIDEALKGGDYNTAFEKMHGVLDHVWEEVDRVLIDNGLVCINIGDATKNCDGEFKLFSNHSRVIHKFMQMGYSVMPDINWHKQTNAPNKFMGSGMYPPGAYVTYEHEYILIFRKGPKREFNSKEKERRRESAYFWEERNVWFSDLWDLKGTSQTIGVKGNRDRSAAFPFELAYRLINMFSIKGDTVYDPFCGLGTVMKAAMTTERSSIGVDIDESMIKIAMDEIEQGYNGFNLRIEDRLLSHRNFIDGLPQIKKEKLYQCKNHSFMVKTRQEVDIIIRKISGISNIQNGFECIYEEADA